MADQKQVKRLIRSVDEWNEWRQERPNSRPDLSYANFRYADLYRANLYGADLSGSDLRETDLCEADLCNADLSRANLYSANLSSANLTEAFLNRADLRETYFSNAMLINANLREVDLSRAILSNADLTHTHFRMTIFAEVDLSVVRGLETAIHDGPSLVNINSVKLPQDEPTLKHFLRGVGFTETQIEYLPSLLTPRPIEYSSLFISYAHQDEVIAQRLYRDLRKKDVPCWFAPHDLQPGNYFRERIDQAIHSQDKLLLLLSEHSVKSGWVRYEVELALARENDQEREILFPVRLDDAIFHCTASWARSLRATRQIGDFTGWRDETAYQDAFTRLLQHLKVTQLPTNRSASS